MKLRLPSALLSALMACLAVPAYSESTSSAPHDLGNVMYVGDSITHGVNSASWRWAMHKIFVDNGLTYTPVGYKTGNNSGGVASGVYYGDQAFINEHSSQSSARAYEVAGRAAGGRFDGTNLQNWLGQSTTKTGGGAYTGSTYDVDTFYLLIGTNDLLSEGDWDGARGTSNTLYPANYDGKVENLLGVTGAGGVRTGYKGDGNKSDMQVILDAMYTEKADAPVTILSIPCWTNHKNNNDTAPHNCVLDYNAELEAWVNAYNTNNGKNALYVDVNKGMVDVASSTPFYGCSSMFNTPGTDGLHPNAQGDLLMAGAVAKAQGYAGRTAGQQRMGASQFAHQAGDFTLTNASLSGNDITLAATGTATLSWDAAADLGNGYTVDFQLSQGLGNGATGGWDATNLSIMLGDGTTAGTLNISEAYIKWGDTVLYSADMSGAAGSTAYTVFDTTESLRVAYVNGNPGLSLTTGYYVWLGDMLIGEGRSGVESTFSGVGITNGTGNNVIVSNLAATEHAYAPTTTGVTNGNPLIMAYTPMAGQDPATKQWTTDTVTNGDCGVSGNSLGLTAGATGTVVGVINSGTAGNASANINNVAHTGDIWVTLSQGAAAGNNTSKFNAVQTGGALTGNMYFKVDASYDDEGTWGTWFGALNQNISGELYMEFSSAAFNIGNNQTYSNVNSSVIGSYSANVGKVSMVFNAGTFDGAVMAGNITNNNNATTGSTSICISGGEFGGPIYAGGYRGTIGSTSVTLTGDKYSIEGNLISAGGLGGTITGDAVLTISGMGTDAAGVAMGTGLTRYSGTLSGSNGSTVQGSRKLNIEDSVCDSFGATLQNFDVVELNRSTITLTGGSLGGATALKLDNASSLTISGSTCGEMQVASSGSITLTGGSSMTLSQTNNDSQISGTFEVQEGSALGMGTGYKTQSTYTIKDGAMLSMTHGATLLGGSISLESGSVVNVLEGATATIQGGLSGHLNLAGPGILVLDEGTTTTLDSLRGGTLLNQGTLTVGDVGPLNSTLINSGDLTITGHISMPQNLAGLTHVQLGVVSTSGEFTPTIGYAAGDAVSGYNYNAYVLVGTDGGTLDISHATLDTGIEDIGDGFVCVQAADYSTYHLNEDATYSTHDAYNVTENGRTVQVEDGYTLTLDRSVQSGVKLATVGDGAVNLNSGTTEISLGTGAATLQNVYVGEGNEATVAHATVQSTPIRVDDGGLLHVNVSNPSQLNFNISKLSGEGTVALANSSNQNVTFTGNAPTAFSGTLELDSKSWNCFNGTFNFASVDGKYASLKLTGSGNGIAVGDYLTEQAALNIGNLSGGAGTHISPAYGSAGTHHIAVHQTVDAVFAGVADGDSNNRKIGILKYGDANLVLSGASSSNGALKVKEGTLTFTTTGSWAGATTVENGATLAFIGGNKNYNGANTTFETGSTLRVLGAGTLAGTEFAAGNLTFASDASISKLIVDEGASATVNAGTTLTIGATMQIDGTFTNNGTLAVSSLANLDAVGGTQYTDRISPTSGNGYETAVYSVYTGNGTVTGLSSLSIAGSETSYEIDSAGQVRVGESNGRYFINQGTVVYGGDDNVAASDTTQFLVLNGGTLELAQALRDGHTISLAVDNATLKIRDGVVQNLVTVNREGATLTLAGDGVYHIGNRQTLNDQVVMGDDWTGAIAISGYFNGLNVSNLARTGSRVRFNGVNGWLVQAYSTIARDVELVDDGDTPALDVTGMSDSFIYGFSGKITGDGTMKFSGGGHSYANNQVRDLTISGDISGWTGKFEEAGTAARSIKFSGSATTINAAVEHTGSAAFTAKIDNNSNVAINNSITNAQGAGAMTLNLTGTGTKTFADSVDVTTLTTAGGAATFNGTLNAATLNMGTAAQGQTAAVNGNVTIGSTGNATLGNVNVNAGTLTLNGTTEMTGTLANSGTVALGASANTTFNNVTMNTGSSMTFAAGTTVQVNGTFNVAEGISVGGRLGSAGHNAVAGSLLATEQASESSVITFTGGDNFVKTGAGNLVVKGYVTLSNTTISGGVLQVQTTSAAGGARLGNVTLDGGALSIYSEADTSTSSHNIIDSLTVRQNSVICSTWARSLTDIKSLTFENNSKLVLEDSHSNGSIAVYYIGGDYAGKGTLEVKQAENRASRHTGVTLQSVDALQDAVVNYSTIASSSAQNAIAIGLNNVKVAGLESSTGANFSNRLNLISRADAAASVMSSDGNFRTLTITGDGAEHSFYGKVLGNLNITMGDGDNTETGSVQKFMGDNSAFNGAITVDKGSLVFGSAVGTTTAIEVNGGSLSLAGGTTAELGISGALTLTAGTLTVNQTFSLSDTGSFTNNGTLALGSNSIIDLTGMAGEAVGNNYAYRIMAEGSTGSVTGLDTLDISRIRANGLGWGSASYADGVITLVRSGAMLEWNTTDAFTWTQTTDPTGFHPIGGAADATQASTATSNVSFNESTTVTLGENITVAGLGVDENKHLTVTANSHTLNAKIINLEAGATLTIDNAAIDYTDTTGIDLSTGSVLELTGAATAGYDHQVLRGDGTLKLGLTQNYGNTVKTGTAFTGTIHITAGRFDLANSSPTCAKWILDNGVDAVFANSSAASTINADVQLNGTHTVHMNNSKTATVNGALTGGNLTAAGSGKLVLNGVVNLDSLTVSTSGHAEAGVSSSVTINNYIGGDYNMTVSGKFVGGENFYKTGNGNLIFNSSARLTLPMLDIRGGSVTIKTNTQDLSIGTVKLASERTLSNYSEGYPVREVAVSQLTLTGTSATSTLKTEYFGGMWKVGGLTLAGNTLTLEAAHASNAWSIYNFTGTQTANDTGVIKVQQTNNGTERCVLVRVAGNDVLRGTELVASKIVTSWRQNNQTKTSDTNYIVFALASGNVEMRGLSAVSSDDLAESALSRVVLVSNTCDLVGTGRTSDNAFWQTAGDGIARTLTLTGTGGVDIYSGVVGSNIHIVMGNATTAAGSHQKFMGNITAFNGDVTVNKGQLTFGNALSTTGAVTVNGGVLTNEAALTAAGVTLNGGTATMGGLLTTGTLEANGGSIAINGGATVSSLTGTGASISAATAQTLTITGEGGTYAGGIGANVNIVMADTATGTQIIGGSMADFNGDVTVNAGTLQLSSGATVDTLTLAEGATITDSGTLSVSSLSAAGGAINNTNLVYTGEAATTISASMDGSSLEVASEAGKVTLSGATKNLVDLTIDTSNNEEPADDILLDADVTVSGIITLENNAQIGFGDNRQLSWNGFTYTTDADSNTKGTISKGAEGTTVTVSNMRIMSTVDEEHSIAFELDNVRLVNTAGTATLTAQGNTLSDIVVSGGKVVLAENTEVTNDVNLAVQSAQLEVAAGKTLTNGVVTLKGANNSALLIDNTTSNASVFYGNGEASAAIITGAEVTVNAAAAPGQSYTWGAQLVDSSLTVTGGSLTLHNSEMHQLSSLRVNDHGTLTVKNGSGFTLNGGTYESNIGEADGTIYKSDAENQTFAINLAKTTISDMTVTLNEKQKTGNTNLTFFAGVKNVDLVRDYEDNDALAVKLDWADSQARDFRNILSKKGEINLGKDKFDYTLKATENVMVEQGATVTVGNGVTLKVDNDILNITASSKATVSATGEGTNSLAGADATAKLSNANITVNNTGSETYEWGAKLEDSTLTTSGDVKLTNSNSVTTLTLNAGSNLTLTGDMTAGSVSIANDATLNIVNAELRAATLSGGTLGLKDSSATSGHVGVVEGGGTGDLKALMAGCSLETTDVVVSAAAAIDAVAAGTDGFMGKTFTIDIFSNVTIGEGITLTLAGMENYRDVTLYWSVVEDAISPASEPTPFAARGLEDEVTPPNSFVYTGGAVNLSELTRGTVVNVWATAVVPEPATGALSVLALAALAARRRRKSSK